MPDPKNLLDRALEGVEPAPDALEESLRRAGRRQRNRRIGSGVVALAVVAAGLGLAANAFLGSGHGRTGVAVPAAPTPPAPSGTGGAPLAAPQGSLLFLAQAHGSSHVLPYVIGAGGGVSRPVVRSAAARGILYVTGASLSPDGSQVALAVSGGEGRPGSIYVVDRNGSDLQRILSFGTPYDVAWSPTGTWLVFDAGGTQGDALYLVRTDGTGLHCLKAAGRCVSGEGPAWSPDGSRIAFYSDAGVSLTAASGGASRPVRLVSLGRVAGLAWSHDGSRIAAAQSSPGPAAIGGGVWVFGSDGQGLHRVYRQASFAVAWSPDDGWIAAGTDSGKVVLVSLGDVRAWRSLTGLGTLRVVQSLDWANGGR